MKKIIWDRLKFNGCEILNPVDLNKNTAFSNFNVKCFCGVVFQTYPARLKSGHTKSCGCFKKKLTEERFKIKRKSYSNFITAFGIKILEPLEKEKDTQRSIWKALCPICGKEFQNTLTALITNNSKTPRSCGCLHLEKSSETFKRVNSTKRINRGNRPDEPLLEVSKLLRTMLCSPIKNLILRIDAYTCQNCESKKRLEVHHITPISSLDMHNKESCEGFYSLNNLITLCHKCHYTIAHLNSFKINPENQELFRKKAYGRKIPEFLLDIHRNMVIEKISPWLNNYFDKEF